MYTEEEASKKWCPMVRTAGEFGSHNEHSFCIASYCMMWREDSTKMYVERDVGKYKGYCGLGGKP